MNQEIETALPLHVPNLHLWWGRSPVHPSIALFKAALAEADGQTAPAPTVCDPFSGCGGLAMAAQGLGLATEAGDLNAVATLLTKAAVEIPPRFANRPPVHASARNAPSVGLQGLAADVKAYGQWMRAQALQQLAAHYPAVKDPESGEELPVSAWVWVRTVPCPNPACGCRMPLATSFVLSRQQDHEHWAEPVITEKELSFVIHKGPCPQEKRSNKHASQGSKFQCPACGTLTTDAYLRQQGKAGNLGAQLMAVCTKTEHARAFFAADDAQQKAAAIPPPEDLPVGSMPNNGRWFGPPGFGLTEYADLYTPRQLSLLTTLCDMIPQVQDKAASDALSAGMEATGGPLADGGCGAYAYGQAIGVYLAIVISRLANYQSAVCTWDSRAGTVRSAFARRAIPMSWVFAEGNPFSAVTGNFDAQLQTVADAIANLSAQNPVTVVQADALTKQYPPNSILFTDLPYYDNIGYADLSDYFYLWMRRCLKATYPALFERVVTAKEELASIPEHFGGDAAAAVKSYRAGIEQLFASFYPAASEAYPSVVFFLYGRADENAIASMQEAAEPSPLEQLLAAIYGAGFMITGLWPLRTEKPSEKFESIRVAVVFQKRQGNPQSTTRRGFVTALKRALPQGLAQVLAAETDEIDRHLAGLGCGLSVFTGYQKVINADGSGMTIHDALQIIHQEVKEAIAVHTADAQTEEE